MLRNAGWFPKRGSGEYGKTREIKGSKMKDKKTVTRGEEKGTGRDE